MKGPIPSTAHHLRSLKQTIAGHRVETRRAKAQGRPEYSCRYMPALLIVFLADKCVNSAIVGWHGLSALNRKSFHKLHSRVASALGIRLHTGDLWALTQFFHIVRHAFKHLDAHLVKVGHNGSFEFKCCHNYVVLIHLQRYEKSVGK